MHWTPSALKLQTGYSRSVTCITALNKLVIIITASKNYICTCTYVFCNIASIMLKNSGLGRKTGWLLKVSIYFGFLWHTLWCVASCYGDGFLRKLFGLQQIGPAAANKFSHFDACCCFYPQVVMYIFFYFALQIYKQGAVGCHSFVVETEVLFLQKSMWRKGNFTPRPETQTFSIVLLLFMRSFSSRDTLTLDSG